MTFFLSVSFAQLDGPCSAPLISGPYNNTIVYGDNFNATSNALNCFYSASRVAWYIISSPTEITVEISTCDIRTDFDTTLFLFTGSNCSSLYCETESDCSISYNAALIDYTLQANVLYYVGVGGSSTGSYFLKYFIFFRTIL